MPDNTNYLVGYGERLTERLAPPAGGGPKRAPYSFTQAQQRLVPRVIEAVREIDALPPEACPGDHSVAALVLHPAYIAKTYFPNAFLEALGVEAVGSRALTVTPEATTRRAAPAPTVTAEIFVAGPRQHFQAFAQELNQWREDTEGAKDLGKIEDFRSASSEDRLKPLRSDSEEPLLEVVLHATDRPESRFILDGFEAYLESLDIPADLGRLIFAEGLCFLPLRVPRPVIADLVKFSFLRLAREMPRLRQFRPVTRVLPGVLDFPCTLPSEGALDPTVKVAIFDGGLPAGNGLDQWASPQEASNLSAPVPEYQWHGNAVTSAFLFGPLRQGEPAPRPYAAVDHYRVLDADTAQDDQYELYDVLTRIRQVLETGTYEFANLSLGPDLPVEDNDVHAWTAVLDQCLSNGKILASVAVGNSGERDWASGNARIQSPSDCVNALSIGSCDSTGDSWKRAPYSSIGPGRSPGIVKPDALVFGGSHHEPYYVLNADSPGDASPITGTSFAAPTALRTAVGIRAHFGRVLSPLVLKTLLLHQAQESKIGKQECGWGRVPIPLEEHVVCKDGSVHIVYQGELSPGQWLRIPIPIPATPLQGNVTLRATFCFASATDPQDPLNYTRSGLEVRFRPHDQKRKEPDKLHADTAPFFQAKEFYLTESELRADAHKWETTLKQSKRFRGSGLQNPVFDIHYNARAGGRATKAGFDIPYALAVTVHAPQAPNLYDLILTRYRTLLEPLQPVIQIPVRT